MTENLKYPDLTTAIYRHSEPSSTKDCPLEYFANVPLVRQNSEIGASSGLAMKSLSRVIVFCGKDSEKIGLMRLAYKQTKFAICGDDTPSSSIKPSATNKTFATSCTANQRNMNVSMPKYLFSFAYWGDFCSVNLLFLQCRWVELSKTMKMVAIFL